MYDSLENIKSRLKIEYEYWNKILGLSDEIDFEKRANRLLSEFSKLKAIADLGTKQRIAKTPLNPEKIEEFINMVGKQWRLNSTIRNIFRKNDLITEVQDDRHELMRVGQKIFMKKQKVCSSKERTM